jgi:hypothetical protein
MIHTTTTTTTTAGSIGLHYWGVKSLCQRSPNIVIGIILVAIGTIGTIVIITIPITVAVIRNVSGSEGGSQER